MGPPGAGKGTQGELLAETLGVSRLSTGDMLREARRAGTELGREARRYMDAGELVPDDVIVGMIGEALDAPAGTSSFVFDGFPRTIEQARGLDELLVARGEELDAVIDLAVGDEELVARISGRRVCESCDAVTHVSTVGDASRCEACGGRLIQRTDDRPETVRRRLQVYRDLTRPVLDYYRESVTPLMTVDGTGAVEEIQDRLMTALQRLAV